MRDKHCPKCGEVKPSIEFYKDITKSGGLSSYCKPCFKKHQRYLLEHSEGYAERQLESNKTKNQREEYRQYHREYTKEYRDNHKIQDGARAVAQRIEIDGTCYFCGGDKNLLRHHYDYSKPKEFFVLCKRCHQKLHILIKLHTSPTKEDK